MAGITIDTRVEKVTKLLINQINTNVYASGEQLPSIEQLSEMLGAGRSTIREALKELQTLGIITIKHGGGTYICEYEKSGKKISLAEQSLEARKAIEGFCARSAALNGSADLTKVLRQLYEEIQKCIDTDNMEAFIECDRRFHYQITRSVSNVLLIKYHTSLDLLFQDVQAKIVSLKGSPQTAQEDHIKIIEAIEAHNPNEAVRCAELHIDHIYEQLDIIKSTDIKGIK